MSTKRRLTKKAFTGWAARKGNAPLKGKYHVCPLDFFLGNKDPTVGYTKRQVRGKEIPLPPWAVAFVAWNDDMHWGSRTGTEVAKYLRNQNSTMRKKK